MRRRHYNKVKLENEIELKHFKHRVAGNCITNSTLQHEISVDIKERRGSPTTPGCSTHSKNPKHPVSKHRTNTHIDAKEARNTTSHRKTCNKKDYT